MIVDMRVQQRSSKRCSNGRRSPFNNPMTTLACRSSGMVYTLEQASRHCTWTDRLYMLHSG